MANKKSSNRKRQHQPVSKIKDPVRPKWMRNLGLVVGIIFLILALLLAVLSTYRYYHLISHH